MKFELLMIYLRLLVLKRFFKKECGQGVVEYAGALLVGAVMVGLVLGGTQRDQWLYTAYIQVFNMAGESLQSQSGLLGS
jgi:Flp pilus assembly pilin Flp